MRNAAGFLKRTARAGWRWLREWSGDAAYERYLRAVATCAGAKPTLTPAQFYLEHLNRKYSHPSRCC